MGETGMGAHRWGRHDTADARRGCKAARPRHRCGRPAAGPAPRHLGPRPGGRRGVSPPHARFRLRPSARALRVLGPGGRGARQGAPLHGGPGRDARRGAHRHQRHVRGAGVLRGRRQGRHPAHHGRPDRRRVRGRGARRQGDLARARGAARAGRGGLRQPARAAVEALPRRDLARAPGDAGRPRRPCRRADLPVRRPGRPGRAPAAVGPPAAGRGAAGAPGRDLPRPTLRGASAPPRRGRPPRARGPVRARPRRDGLRHGSAAGGHQRRLLPRRGDVRGARRLPLRGPGRLRRSERAPPAAHARALVQAPGRHAGAVRGPAGGLRQHRRDRAALRVPAPDTRADPAALRGQRGGGAAPAGARGARAPPGGHPPRRARGRVRGAARVRARRDRADGLPWLLPDRGRLHPVGQGAGDPRGPRPRLGRGEPGGLRADDHGSGSAALLAAVRAVPEPRPGVDARLRHRLLHGPPRGGHPLRAGALRPRAGGPDHHLRRAAVQGRRARRRPRPPDALHAVRRAVEDGASGGGEARADPPGAADGAAARRGGAQAGRGSAPRLLRQAGGAPSQRLHPRRGRRHRGPAARRAGAALPRPALGDARDAVQHEVGRAGGAGEVRLPRAEDPDDDPQRAGPPGGPRRAGGPRPYPARRRARLCALRLGQDDRGVPGGILGHDRRAAPHAADLHRGHRGARGALPPGAHGEHPAVLRRQERAQAARAPAPFHRPHPGRDPGDHRLSGAGHGDRPRDGGLLAGRGRPSAARHGQEDPGRDGRAAPALPRRRRRARGARGEGAGGLEPARQVRQLRLQQVPRRGLRGGELPDGLAQGEPPGRVHGRRDELRHPPHRQARGLRRGRPSQPPAGDRAALREPLGGALRHRRGAHRLRPRRASRTSVSRPCA